MQGKLLTSFVALLAFSGVNAQIQGYNVGEVVDDFTVTDTQGNEHNLYEITASGKHVVLDFFFDTCPPCQATQPIFNEMHETYGCNGADLYVISINNGTDNNAAVDAFEETFGGSFRHSPAVGIEGGCATVDGAFNPVAYPTYCLIGPDNQLKNSDIWPIADLQSFVDAFPAGSNIQTAACALVSVNENNNAAVKGIFPVPAIGPVTVDLALNTTGAVDLDILDALGRVVRTETLGTRAAGNFVHQMDLGELSNGNYIVRLALDGVPTSTHQLVIAR